jgi:hypothetical protein
MSPCPEQSLRHMPPSGLVGEKRLSGGGETRLGGTTVGLARPVRNVDGQRNKVPFSSH